MTQEEMQLLDEIKTKVDQLEAKVKARLVKSRNEGNEKQVAARAIEIGGIVAIRAALDTLG